MSRILSSTKLRRYLSQISLIAVAVLFSIGLQTFAFTNQAGTFTEPTQSPPNGNAFAPLNTGPGGQQKMGGLIINTGNAATGLIVANGNVGIGTSNPTTKLQVSGDVLSSGYIQSNSFVQGTKFYDLNTNYYLDPAGTSNINAVNVKSVKFPDGTVQTTATKSSVVQNGQYNPTSYRIFGNAWRGRVISRGTHTGSNPVFITFSSVFSAPSNWADGRFLVRVVRTGGKGSAVIYSGGPFWVTHGYAIPFSGSSVDNPGTGAFSYSLQVKEAYNSTYSFMSDNSIMTSYSK